MVKTRIFCLADTHNESLNVIPQERFDVVIHCGDLTNTSTLSELRLAVQQLAHIDAPLKLVIPGNHDATLDPEAYYRTISHLDRQASARQDEFLAIYGLWEEAMQVFLDVRDTGIVLLPQGTHNFTLENGASLRVYANPYTPSETPTGGFQYCPGDGAVYFSDLREHVDVVMTHGPPRGMLDQDYESRLCGCPDLAAAISRARPLLHVFGHIHEGWGATYATWDRRTGQVDSDSTWVLRSWKTPGSEDIEPEDWENQQRVYELRRHCSHDDLPLQRGRNTLFLNVAVRRNDSRIPWVVELDLPPARKSA